MLQCCAVLSSLRDHAGTAAVLSVCCSSSSKAKQQRGACLVVIIVCAKVLTWRWLGADVGLMGGGD
jgi:hypothetical protein